MLEFKGVRIEDYKKAAPIMRKSGFNSTECSFPALLLWSALYTIQICIEDETVWIRFVKDGKSTYIVPFGEDIKGALLKIREISPDEDIVFGAVTEEMREKLEEAFPGEFEYTEKRNIFDYIYLTEKLASLSGNKLHQKRNHVNKFIKRYEGRFSYEGLTEENIPEVIEFQKEWVEMSIARGNEADIRYESEMIVKLLNSFREFDFIGGVVRIDGKVRAYCIGSKTRDDTVDVMVEKGDYAFDGIYQFINKKFAESLLGKVEFLNREDDAGVEGLRKSKLSYNPAILLKKYGAVWKK